MTSSPNGSRFLDEEQQKIEETFQAHANALREAAELRYEENLQSRFTANIREQIAERARSLILQLADHIDATAEEVPEMSTYSGLVYPLNAPEYVEEELKRLEHLYALKHWEKAHKKHWDHMFKTAGHNAMGISQDWQTEDVVYAETKYVLSGPIKNLSLEEDCRRSSLVLHEVQSRRSSIRWRVLTSVADAPAQLVYALSIGGAAIGNALISMSVAGGSAALQSSATYLSCRKDMADLKRVESDMITRLTIHHRDNPECVEDSIFSAGIQQHPKKVLGLTE